MAGNRTLKLSILADVDDLKKKLGDGGKEVDGFGGKLEKFGKVAAAAFAAAAAAAVAYAGKLAIDGVKAAENPNGYLPQSSVTSNNYIGKSNWINPSSNYENAPELFHGSLFDLRGYNQAVNKKKLEKTIEWGKKRLGIKITESE